MAADVQVLMAVIETYGDQRKGFGWAAARDDGDSAGMYSVEGEKCLAIIRSMLAPVAPDPGLREAIAKALAIHAGGSEHEENFDGWVEQFDGETDAVLAVLAERGMA